MRRLAHPPPAYASLGSVKTLTSRGLVRAVVLVALLGAVVPAGAGAVTKAIWADPNRSLSSQFPIFKRLKVSIFQYDLLWREAASTRPRHPANPRDPAYHWPASVAEVLRLAGRYHMRVLLQVSGVPSWANGGRPASWVPNNPRDFAAFMTAAARHYSNVHLWMIWGEPTRGGLFEPLHAAKPGRSLNARQKIAPHNYARLLDLAYGALKRVSPRNTVIGGSTYTTGEIDTEQWIQNLRLPNGHAPRMDMYAHNPFSTEAPNFSDPPSPAGAVQFSDLKRLGGWIDRYLKPGLPLFLSEWTIPSCPDYEFNYYVDQPVAARWISDAFRLSRQWRRIYALGWIHIYDNIPAWCGGLFDNHDKPKPLYYAFQRG